MERAGQNDIESWLPRANISSRKATRLERLALLYLNVRGTLASAGE